MLSPQLIDDPVSTAAYRPTSNDGTFYLVTNDDGTKIALADATPQQLESWYGQKRNEYLRENVGDRVNTAHFTDIFIPMAINYERETTAKQVQRKQDNLVENSLAEHGKLAQSACMKIVTNPNYGVNPAEDSRLIGEEINKIKNVMIS